MGIIPYTFYYSLTSGKPTSEVKIESSADNSDADIKVFQSICENTAELPITAIAVCAKVFTARISAAFIHFLVFSFIFSPL